ncbi:MAG: hypothetical protein WB771_14615 [Solirubrobacterales bacterium]
MFATALALIAQSFSGRDRAVAFGVFGAITGVEPMFDIRLLRKPTFDGGLIAAFAMNGSLFSLLTYLILYFQQTLGYSAAATGVRFLPLTGAIFLAAGIAGRLSERVPMRLLIAPGFALVAAGLLLMRGLTVDAGWTHFSTGHDHRRGRCRVCQYAARGHRCRRR